MSDHPCTICPNMADGECGSRCEVLCDYAFELKIETERYEKVLREIADASPMPDDAEWYGTGQFAGDYAGYTHRLADGTTRTTGVDESNSGDVHEHGWAMGEWTAAKKARAALKA